MDYFSKIRDISAKAFIGEDEALKVLAPHLDSFRRRDRLARNEAEIVLEKLAEREPDLVQKLFAQYPLKSEQGYAIMSLAEALPRIPDSDTAHELIEDRLGSVKSWKNDHAGSFLMRAASAALDVGAKLGGNLLTSTAVKTALNIMSREFILGESIDDAQRNAEKAKKRGYLISYDMLGEGARTTAQAKAYLGAYLEGVRECDAGREIFENDSISVKLSALHPRYELLKHEQIAEELLPRVREIILAAKQRNVAVTIDAEEARRLDLSLLVFTELFLDDNLRYDGLGLAVQAYQKRAIYVLNYLRELSEHKGQRIPVRLVKGAYWDSEIKKAQADGVADYPVFTHKAHTDLSYMACAEFMLANDKNFYPQFATHNLLTICAIISVAGKSPYEFQKLQGMGNEIYDGIMQREKIKCRIYAPVGEQKELLAYLIRRLIENGANTSFLHQLGSGNFDEALASPFGYKPVKEMAKPAEIFPLRENSKGYDLGNLAQLEEIKCGVDEAIIPDMVIGDSTAKECKKAVKTALAQTEWKNMALAERAGVIRKIADIYEERKFELLKLLMEEGRKTLADGIAEIREAQDFCRYYAAQALQQLGAEKTVGITGEENVLSYEPRGVFVCISPWNFPLAIYTGQIVAALVAGNSVIAKPAEQTPKIALHAFNIMHLAGVPEDALQIIFGDGEVVGNTLVSSPDISGVCFTGSTAAAKSIAAAISENNPAIIPFIAETGGQNCMIVDSTALIEHSVDDIIMSAFGSAGQRCSALRVCYVQDDIADDLLDMLAGAMRELEVVHSAKLSADVGEVIDTEARKGLEQHIRKMKKEARLVYGCKAAADGNFVPPHLFEIESIRQLEREVFGPVLHVIRFKYEDIDRVIEDVNSTGYGLTFGLQTRIMGRVKAISGKIRAGNVYVNRTTIGAVVESQPFGGMGLSGTGPKAGGKDYLRRFCAEKLVTNNTTAIGGNMELM